MAETWQQWERAASGHRDSTMSLQELEPSPIESPDENFEKIDFPDVEKALEPQPGLLPRTSTLGLSGGTHGAVYYLTRIQRYSSYSFLVFSTFHITNTSILPLITRSVPAADNYLLLTRPYYQSFPLEPLLITIPLVAHVTSGLALRLYRRNQSLTKYGGRHIPASERMRDHISIWPTLSNISVGGYILSPLVLGHAALNRILPWIVDGGSSSVGLGFVSHGFAKHPFLANAGYAALVSVFSGHLVWGMAKYRGWSQVTSTSSKVGKRRWWLLNVASVALAGLWMAGGLGVVGRGGAGTGWVATLWDDIYSRVPLLSL